MIVGFTLAQALKVDLAVEKFVIVEIKKARERWVQIEIKNVPFNKVPVGHGLGEAVTPFLGENIEGTVCRQLLCLNLRDNVFQAFCLSEYLVRVLDAFERFFESGDGSRQVNVKADRAGVAVMRSSGERLSRLNYR